MSGFPLNPNAVEFSFSNETPSSWNALASDFIPFEPSPSSNPPLPPVEVSIPAVQRPSKKIYTYEVLISLRESNKQLPEGVSIPDTYSKTGVKSKNTKKGAQPVKSSTIKRAENQLNTLAKTEKPFLEKIKKQTDEHEKKSREIRSMLNKLTDRNFEKLLVELTSLEYDQQLLASLTNFIFERATAMNFPSLYSKLCSSLRKSFKKNNLSSVFRKSIVEKCRECFYNEDMPMENDKLMEAEFKRRRRLIGNIKFIALLHQVKMIKSEIMFECFEVLLDPKSLSDETLETCVTLFKDTCPILVGNFPEDVHKYYEKLIRLNDSPSFCKRVLFMIQDLIEVKDQLMIPRTSRPSPVKRVAKVEVRVEETVEEVGLNDETKESIKNLTKMLVQGPMDEDWKERFQGIFKENLKMHTEVFVQILKYGLYEYFKRELIVAVCEVNKMLVREFCLDQDVIHKAMVVVQRDFNEIKIDSPSAEGMYLIMQNEFSIS